MEGSARLAVASPAPLASKPPSIAASGAPSASKPLSSIAVGSPAPSASKPLSSIAAPPAAGPRPAPTAGRARVSPPALTDLPPLRVVSGPSAPPSRPAAGAPRPTSSSAASLSAALADTVRVGAISHEVVPDPPKPAEPAVIVDEGWAAAARQAGSAGPRTPAGPLGFPRSAAERAGAAASPRSAIRRAAVPTRSTARSLAAVAAPVESVEPVERPAQLAQGSVTAPLPAADRRRPPTVELPTIESADLPPERVFIAPRPIEVATAAKTLPSIYSVIDRRHTPGTRSDAGPLASMTSGPVAPAGPAAAAAPRAPLAASSPVDRRPPAAAPPAAAPADPPRPVEPARAARRRPGSFSEADAAFFAAGEELERGGSFEEEFEERASAKRPTLWRRLTGRRNTP